MTHFQAFAWGGAVKPTRNLVLTKRTLLCLWGIKRFAHTLNVRSCVRPLGLRPRFGSPPVVRALAPPTPPFWGGFALSPYRGCLEMRPLQRKVYSDGLAPPPLPCGLKWLTGTATAGLCAFMAVWGTPVSHLNYYIINKTHTHTPRLFAQLLENSWFGCAFSLFCGKRFCCRVPHLWEMESVGFYDCAVFQGTYRTRNLNQPANHRPRRMIGSALLDPRSEKEENCLKSAD